MPDSFHILSIVFLPSDMSSAACACDAEDGSVAVGCRDFWPLESGPQFTSYEQLPITLTADHVAAALGISRANAYILLRSDGFPTLHIGKRMVVPKDRFLQWITDSVNG